MKSFCERCRRVFQTQTETRVCAHECTFCSDCATAMNDICPNCGGPLRARAGSV